MLTNINPRIYLNSIIKAMPRFMDATYEQLIQLLHHRWKEYYLEAIMGKVGTPAKVRELAK